MPDVIGEAFIAIRPETSGFSQQAKTKVASEGQKMGKQFGGLFAAGAGVAVGVFLKGAFGEAAQAQKVAAQTAAVIKSTGGAAKVTAGQVDGLANSLSKTAGIDDEVIASGENMLLTFKNIRNERGKGNDVFNQATKATLDMAVAMKGANGGVVDLKGSSIQLGKALNDPVKGIAALHRVGVDFDPVQKKMIENFVAQGDIMSAQKIILKEVTSEFGGSAAAQATSSDKMKVAFGNLQESVGTLLLPVLNGLISVLQPITEFLTEHTTLATALAIVVGGVLVAAFVAWTASMVAAGIAGAVAFAPVLFVLAIIGLAIADGILIWRRWGDAIVGVVNDYVIPALNGIIGVINGVIDALNLIPGVSIGNIGTVGEIGGGVGQARAAGTYDVPRNQGLGGLYGTGPGGPNPFVRKAVGGPVTAGGRYLVGEHGPEMFSPNSAGSITPNQWLGGHAGLTIAGDLVVRDTAVLADLDYWSITRTAAGGI